MKPTILQNIFEQKKLRVEEAKKGFDYSEFVNRAKRFRMEKTPFRFQTAFEEKTAINIIAEIKRASPSRGVIKESADIGEIAASYENFGAKAISVLTEEDFFKGSIEDLIAAKKMTDIPILRKDFIFDEFQLFESALIGADAILLIVGMLNDKDLLDLHRLAESLGIDVLLETHNFEELERAKNLGAKIIGVNNRDLKTFDVSLDVSRELIGHAPKDAFMICESGLSKKEELIEMKKLGFDGFLIGESLMKSGDLENKLRELTT